MIAKRRTKIVATVGPAIKSKEALETAIKAGVNVFRLNFSHGSHEDHKNSIHNIRALSKELNAPLAILQDLQGPKIRVGKLKNGAVTLKEGTHIKIDAAIELGDESVLSTDFKELPESCKEGTKILLDDGRMELRVRSVKGSVVECEVIYGGVLKDRKGMNLPGAMLPVDAMTAKDVDDLDFGLANNVDYIALSFVRTASDIKKLKEIIDSKGSTAKVVAKIEMLEALHNLVEIIEVSDAVMVARGDLAVEVGAAQLPLVQKRIIAFCNEIGRPVITATQMLDSMVESPTPTRAEITDVANAVLDGSDALMLSAESASGKYPIKCIQTMHDIILEVERTGQVYYDISLDEEHMQVAETISASACLSALKLNAPVIVCLSTTGKTAVLISRFRPRAQIIACTHVIETLNRLELVWGIQTASIPYYNSSDEAISGIESMLLSYGLAKPGDKVILTLGMPVRQGAKTNTMRIFELGKVNKNPTTQNLPLRYQE